MEDTQYENLQRQILQLKIAVANPKEIVKIDPYEISSRICISNSRSYTSYMKIPTTIPYNCNHIMVNNNGTSILLPYIEDNSFKFVYSNNGGEGFSQGTTDMTFTNPLIVSVKAYGTSSFSVLINDDGNIYLLRGTFPSYLSSPGLIASGYTPLSHDISDNGQYITILARINNSINCFYSTNSGTRYDPLDIANYGALTILSITKIKMSRNGKFQQLFISRENDNNNSVITTKYICNLIHDSTFLFSNAVSISNIDYKKVIDFEIDEYGYKSILLLQSYDSDLKSIGHCQGIHEISSPVFSIHDLEDGYSNFSSFNLSGNVGIITLENSNDILFSSNQFNLINRIRYLINCDTIVNTGFYNKGSSVLFMYNRNNKKYILGVDMNIEPDFKRFNCYLFNSVSVENVGNVKQHFLTEYDYKLILYTTDCNGDTFINISDEVIRKLCGKIITIIRQGEQTIEIRLDHESLNDNNKFYPTDLSLYGLYTDGDVANFLSDGKNLFIV